MSTTVTAEDKRPYQAEPIELKFERKSFKDLDIVGGTIDLNKALHNKPGGKLLAEPLENARPLSYPTAHQRSGGRVVSTDFDFKLGVTREGSVVVQVTPNSQMKFSPPESALFTIGTFDEFQGKFTPVKQLSSSEAGEGAKGLLSVVKAKLDR